jgi:CHASE3 domain sensor protein
MDPAEIKRLMAEVSAQHGIRIDPDDPIMAVVTLNRLILERTLSRATDLIQKATEEFNRATERVQIRAGSVVADEVRGAVSTVRAEIQKDIDNARLKANELVAQVHRAELRSRNWQWIVMGLFAGVGLFIAGVLTGILVR